LHYRERYGFTPKHEHEVFHSHPGMSFPSGFVWGAAAASYQIEGAYSEDGKGLSVWDIMARQPGKVVDGHTGDVACDHYHCYAGDVGLMKDAGLQAYRLSISWPRVLPEGVGSINQVGLDFYDRLIDELLRTKIDPWVTLFHWDYPYALFLRGGWLNPDSPKWFAEYTTVIVDRISDRVSHWITLNEPQCFIGLGHSTGEHAPGLKLGLAETLLAGHHSLLAHGLAVEVIRTRAKHKPRIGWAPATHGYYPKTESAADIEAARTLTNGVSPAHFWNNSWWGDPPLLGHYPEEGLRVYGKAVPKFKQSDFNIIHQPLDFYGCNIYTGTPAEAGKDGKPKALDFPAGHPQTHFLWKVVPESVYWGPKFLFERYNLPVIITENGLSCHDWVALDGRVHDPARIDFLTRYLLEVQRAIEDGVDIQGYFHWSIMDNFEWAEGYKHRFGLIHVDFATQKRVLKDSAYWYRDVIRTNGDILMDSKQSPARDRVPHPSSDLVAHGNGRVA
jgi:beta-glucosidase